MQKVVHAPAPAACRLLSCRRLLAAAVATYCATLPLLAAPHASPSRAAHARPRRAPQRRSTARARARRLGPVLALARSRACLAPARLLGTSVDPPFKLWD